MKRAIAVLFFIVAAVVAGHARAAGDDGASLTAWKGAMTPVAAVSDLTLAAPQAAAAKYVWLSAYYSGSTFGGGILQYFATCPYVPDKGISFAVSGGGCWVRQFTGAIPASFYGAYGDGTHNDTAALQAWLNALIGLGGTGTYNAGYLCGRFKVTSGLSLSFGKVSQRQGPQIHTCGSQKTVIDGSALSSGTLLTLRGAQGVSNVGRIEALSLIGPGGASSVTALTTRQAGSLRFQDWSISGFGTGIEFLNTATGEYTEDDVCVHCGFTHTHRAIYYNQAEGSSSFKGSGCQDCFFAQERGDADPMIYITPRAIVYQAPLDFHVISNAAGPVSATLIDNESAMAPTFYGNFQLEMSSQAITIASGRGADVYYAGNFNAFGARENTTTALKFGKFNLVESYSQTNGGVHTQYKNQTCVGSIEVRAGSTVPVPVNCGAALSLNMGVAALANVNLTISNGWQYQSCYNVIMGNGAPNITQAAACSPYQVNKGNFGPPVVGTSGRNLTFTNANWNGTLTYRITVVDLNNNFVH